jgi:hypothetical protein
MKSDLLVKQDELSELLWHFATCARQPLPNVSVSLRAIACRAARDDVAGVGDPAFGYGNYVIPGRCRLWAVGTEALELLKTTFLADDRKGSDLAFPSVSMLAPLRSIREILRIALAINGALMFTAPAPGKHLINWQPSAASAAPSLARCRSYSALA